MIPITYIIVYPRLCFELLSFFFFFFFVLLLSLSTAISTFRTRGTFPSFVLIFIQVFPFCEVPFLIHVSTTTFTVAPSPFRHSFVFLLSLPNRTNITKRSVPRLIVGTRVLFFCFIFLRKRKFLFFVPWIYCFFFSPGSLSQLTLFKFQYYQFSAFFYARVVVFCCLYT